MEELGGSGAESTEEFEGNGAGSMEGVGVRHGDAGASQHSTSASTRGCAPGISVRAHVSCTVYTLSDVI